MSWVSFFMYISSGLLPCVLYAGGPAGTYSISTADPALELLRDPTFQRGFIVLKAAPGKRVEEGRLFFADRGSAPAWFLDQWNSRFPLGEAQPHRLSQGGIEYSNQAKSVIVNPHNSANADLILSVDVKPEYEKPRTNSTQPWVHLLVEQDITQCPPLTEFKHLHFHIEARILHAERYPFTGYTPNLHCAQIQFVMIVQNRRSGSPGYGDFLWFCIPLYDDRYPLPPPFVAQDFADPSAKLIYNPGAQAFTKESLHQGSWVTIDTDLYPHIIKALETAWAKGYLKDSHNISDYRIIETNLGWEVPGLNKVSAQIRNLSLKVEQ